MVEFIAYYRGRTHGDARIVAVTGAPRIVHFVRQALGEPEPGSDIVIEPAQSALPADAPEASEASRQ